MHIWCAWSVKGRGDSAGMQAERTGGANVTILDFGEAEEVGPCTTRVGAGEMKWPSSRRASDMVGGLHTRRTADQYAG